MRTGKHRPGPVNPPRIDLTGRVFGRLTVEGFHGRDDRRAALWVCRCDCGNEERVIVLHSSLTFGLKKSCGCLRPNHGKKKRGPRPVAFVELVRRELTEQERERLAAYRSSVPPAPVLSPFTWMH